MSDITQMTPCRNVISIEQGANAVLFLFIWLALLFKQQAFKFVMSSLQSSLTKTGIFFSKS